MRYIVNDNGYLLQVSFGAMIECDGRSCTEYTGGVPSGYTSLADWSIKEADKLHRWYILEGELTLDPEAPEPEVEPAPTPVMIPITAMEKIWSNDKLDDGMDAGSVDIDLTGYQGVSILYKNESTGTLYLNTGYIPKGCKSAMMYSYQSGNHARREFTTSDTGIEFGEGVYSGGTTKKIHCVPAEIYGWTTKMFRAYKNEAEGTTAAICGTFLCGELVCG